MNPLKQTQRRTLDSINCGDLGRKVDEIVSYLNAQEEKKIEENEPEFVVEDTCAFTEREVKLARDLERKRVKKEILKEFEKRFYDFEKVRIGDVKKIIEKV